MEYNLYLIVWEYESIVNQKVAVSSHPVEDSELLPLRELLVRVAQGRVGHRVKVRGHLPLVVVCHVPVGDEGVDHPLLLLTGRRDHVLPRHHSTHSPSVLVVGQVVLQLYTWLYTRPDISQYPTSPSLTPFIKI